MKGRRVGKAGEKREGEEEKREMKHGHFVHLGGKVHSRFCIKKFGAERRVVVRGGALK